MRKKMDTSISLGPTERKAGRLESASALDGVPLCSSCAARRHIRGLAAAQPRADKCILTSESCCSRTDSLSSLLLRISARLSTHRRVSRDWQIQMPSCLCNRCFELPTLILRRELVSFVSQLNTQHTRPELIHTRIPVARERERARERDSERESARARERESERASERVYYCMWPCLCV